MARARASSDVRLGNPACYAWFLLDLEDATARQFLETDAFHGDSSKQRDAITAITYHLGEDGTKKWASDLLVRLLNEQRLSHDLLDEVAWSLGRAHNKAAAPALKDALKRDLRLGGAVYALGEVGDASVVPLLLESFDKGGDKRGIIEALGHVPTTEAIDFLIDHIDQDPAAEYLARIHVDRAQSAILKEQRRPQTDKRHQAAVTVAWIRLKNPDAAPVLLEMANDPRTDMGLRAEALIALKDYDIAPILDEVLALFQREQDTSLRRYALWLLESRPKDARVTQALIDAAVRAATAKSKDDLATDGSLLNALNKRLALRFRRLEDLQACLKRQRTP
jgi:hypothetical protein